jgi:hypothetical protein
MNKDIRIWVTVKRVTYKIRSGHGPLIRDYEKGLKWWSFGRIWIEFLFGIFWGNFWRRGTHVNTPKNGSRGEGKCLGEFWEFHADLRRKCFWGNLNLTLFWGLGAGPRVSIEVGGQLVFFCAFEGVFLGELPCHVWMGWPIWPRY